ncbi:MAG: acyl-CoA dehydrogenase family protein, partial [Gemmatimonadota bacterium]
MTLNLSDARPALTTLTEQEQMFREAAREFAQSEVAPKIMEMDKAQSLDPGLIQQLFELGLMAIEIPDEHGGAGADFFSSVLVVEELSRVDPSVAVIVDVQNTLVINALLRWASQEQLARILPRLAADTVGAYALSEVGSGSDAFGLRCRAQADGDDWVLDGRKMWITNGGEAGLFIIFATVDPDAGYKGITAFLVERDADG